MKECFRIGDLVCEGREYPSHRSRGLIKGVIVKEDELQPTVRILQSTGADSVGIERRIPYYALEKYHPMSRAKLYFDMHPDCEKLEESYGDYPKAPNGCCLCAKDVGYVDKCFAGEGMFDCRDCWSSTVDNSCVDCYGE